MPASTHPMLDADLTTHLYTDYPRRSREATKFQAFLQPAVLTSNARLTWGLRACWRGDKVPFADDGLLQHQAFHRAPNRVSPPRAARPDPRHIPRRSHGGPRRIARSLSRIRPRAGRDAAGF